MVVRASNANIVYVNRDELIRRVRNLRLRFPTSATTAINSAVNIAYGMRNEELPIAGKTVADARKATQSLWKVPRDAVAYIDGEQMDEEYELQPGDRLEFVKECGLKEGDQSTAHGKQLPTPPTPKPKPEPESPTADGEQLREPNSKSEPTTADRKQLPRRAEQRTGTAFPIDQLNFDKYRPRQSTPQAYADKKETIEAINMVRPGLIRLDEFQNAIFGHDEIRIADELGIWCNTPVEIMFYGEGEFAEATKFIDVLSHDFPDPTTTQTEKKTDYVTNFLLLLGKPKLTDRFFAKKVGCSAKFVKDRINELLKDGRIQPLEPGERQIGENGKTYHNYRLVVSDKGGKELSDIYAYAKDINKQRDRTYDSVSVQRQIDKARRIEADKALYDRLRPFDAEAAAREGWHHRNFRDTDDLIVPGSVDLFYIDTPYDWLWQLENIAAIAQKIERGLKEHGIALIFVGFENYEIAIERIKQATDLRPHTSIFIKWLASVARCYRNNRKNLYEGENIVVLSKGVPEFPNGFHNFYESQSKNAPKDRKWHKWQKVLLDDTALIKRYSRPQDLVVDFCCGGGTTKIACHDLGRRCITCDVHEKYIRIAQERLRHHIQEHEDLLRQWQDNGGRGIPPKNWKPTD